MNTPSYRLALEGLRRTADEAERAQRHRPRDKALQMQAAQAKRDPPYLQARDYARGISTEEWSAHLRVTRGRI